MLLSVKEVAQQIRQGDRLLLAGDEEALRTLPSGDWIAGTTPYFMDRDGGICSRDRIFATRLPAFVTEIRLQNNSAHTLPGLLEDAPENGFTVLILPAGSPVHTAYARDAASYPGMFVKPVVGWIAGVHVSEAGARSPKVVNGATGFWSSDQSVAMHVALPPDKFVELDIVNVFAPGSGARLQFLATGFEASKCLVDGKEAFLVDYLRNAHTDTRLPLTADYNGSIVNVSIQSVDWINGLVKFYAPVFEGIEYRQAAPVDDYIRAFETATRDRVDAFFACNCVLNYLYCQMEGRMIGTVTGPVTYGEIAYLLLNQTLVRLFIHD